MTDSSDAPGPLAAYTQWVAACADAGWHPATPVEQVPVTAALGQVSAAAVRARWPSPQLPCAAMDGIAVAAARVAGPGDVVLPASAFTWVDTGDLLPAWTDSVVERERVDQRADGSAAVAGPVAAGRNVRAAGEDFRAGQVLVPAGRRLRAADLGAAAAAGHAVLDVARRPCVVIIPTGDEIRPAGVTPAPGEFTDSNSVMLAALATAAGAVPAVTCVQPDDPDVLAAAAREAARTADLVLVLAGSSRGRGDYAPTVLAQVGGVAVHGVAVRPGHPVLLGHVKPGSGVSSGAVPAIGVPGYPLATAVIFELFAAPLLARLQGLTSQRTPVAARLGREWASPPGVEEWVPVTLTPAVGALPAAVPVHGHGAGSTSRLAAADAWWRIPIGQGQFTAGETIGVLPLE